MYSHRNEVDDCLVIRIALCFDKTSSIDFALREIDLGFSLHELISEFTIEGKCSLTITDLFDSKRVVLDKKLALRLHGVVTFARSLLVKLGEELILCGEEDKIKADILATEEAEIQARKDARTADSHPDNPNFGRIVIGYDKEKVTKTGHQLETQRIMTERRRKRLWQIVGLCRGTKGSLVELSFKSISSLFFSSSLLASYRPLGLTRSFFTTPGALTTLFRGWSQKVSDYITSGKKEIWFFLPLCHPTLTSTHLHQTTLVALVAVQESIIKVKEDEERRERTKREEEENRQGGMGDMERRREQLAKDKARLAARLDSLGIEVDETLLQGQKVEITPEEKRREWKTTQMGSRANVIVMLGKLRDVCVGVNAVTLLSGTNKFEVSMQGFDIFELLPEVDVVVGKGK